jgi:hypothetical protein
VAPFIHVTTDGKKTKIVVFQRFFKDFSNFWKLIKNWDNYRMQTGLNKLPPNYFKIVFNNKRSQLIRTSSIEAEHLLEWVRVKQRRYSPLISV